MKKVGICTLHDAAPNFGATLQAFALQEVLKKLDYEPEFLKFKKENRHERDVINKLIENDDLVISLASVEYEKAITPYLQTHDRFIKCIFGEEIDGKIKQKATLAKMARGNMVRYLAENQIQTIEGVKQFNIGGYHFREDLSTDEKLVFELVK